MWPGDKMQGFSGQGLLVTSSVGAVLLRLPKELWGEVIDCTSSWQRKRITARSFQTPYRGKSLSHTMKERSMA